MAERPDSTQRHPDIANYIEQLEQIKVEANQLLAGITASQFNWTPDPRRWSIGQCVEHLNITGELQLEALKDPVEQLRKDNLTTTRPFKIRFLARKFLKSLEPPVKQRFRSPKVYKPGLPLSWERELERFLKLQDDCIALLNGADGLDLTAIKVASPAARWLRFPAAVWLASIPAHERRHLWQIRQLMAEPGFPAAE